MSKGNSSNLGVSLRLCFGLPKTKNASHSVFWANARHSYTTPPDVDDLLEGETFMTGRLWWFQDRL